MTRRGIAVAVLSLAAVALHAQQNDRARLLDEQIGRIFDAREYDAPRFGPARWMADGAAYTVVERDGAAGADNVRYDASTGERTILVPRSRLVPPGGATPLDVDDYAWSRDGRGLLVFTNTKKVWRRNTRGDYWVLDVAGGTLRRLGAAAPESSLMFAKFSPDGSRVAYVRANNLYVERLDDGRVAALTSDGSETTINGTSDWVYEEELDLRDGFRWSPDGQRIAYWQLDSSGVHDFFLINDTDSLYSRVIPVQYPKTGTTNSAARVGVGSSTGGATRWLEVPGDPRNNYMARMEWAGTTNEVYLQHLNRPQNQNDILLADATTG